MVQMRKATLQVPGHLVPSARKVVGCQVKARLVTMSDVLLLSALLTASPLNTGHAKGRPSLNFVLSAIDRRCKRCGRPTAPDRGSI